MHPAVEGAPGHVWWSGVRMERRFIEARARRISPQALARSPHHRLAWTHRALSFCPETFEELVSVCPACTRELGWVHTHGPTKCEHCRASLLQVETATVPQRLHGSLRAATDLISHDPQTRALALAELPAEFHAWDPGEVFVAMVEFGFAWSHPDEGGVSPAAKALREGSLGLITPEHLATGYDVVCAWPTPLAELLAATLGASGSTSLRNVSTLGRFLANGRLDTPIRGLLLRHLQQASLDAGVSIKLGSLAHKLTRAPATTLNLNEAQSRFGVDKVTLRRLVPDGESCLASRLGRGGAVHLDSARLEQAVSAYRNAIDAAQAGLLLGAPAYLLPELAAAGLFSSINDPDTHLLARSDTLFERASVQAFIDDVRAQAPLPPHHCIPLSHALRRQFSPHVWVRTFKAIISGQLSGYAMSATDEDGSSAFSDTIHVDADDAAEFLATIRRRTVPAGVVLNASTAARMIGIPEYCMRELNEDGVLKATEHARGLEIRLEDLVRFCSEYETSIEFSQRFKVPVGYVSAILQKSDWVRRTPHLRYWKRIEAPDFLS